MSFTASSVVRGFRLTFPDCSASDALSILNEVDEEIQANLPLRLDDHYLTMVSNTCYYAIPDTITRIEAAELLYPNRARTPLTASSEGRLEFENGGWRGMFGLPQMFTSTSDTGGPSVGLFPTPNSNYSNFVITNATNATPIVITTSTAHGLTDSQQVVIQNVLGNTNANGFYYAKVTGYSTTTFALYSDAALTTAVAGSGAYTSGGVLGTATRPIVALRVNRRQTITVSPDTTFAFGPAIKRLYENGMRFIWATKQYPEQVGLWKSAFDEAMIEQTRILQGKSVDSPVSIRTFRQNQSWRRGRTYERY